VSSAAGWPPEAWNEWIRGHWRIENGSHRVRNVSFAEDASRIRKNPDIVARMRSFAHNLLRASGCDNIKNARWRAAIYINTLLRMPGLAEN
jgi:predicted transposase YbfD/YdcC